MKYREFFAAQQMRESIGAVEERCVRTEEVADAMEDGLEANHTQVREVGNDRTTTNQREAAGRGEEGAGMAGAAGGAGV